MINSVPISVLREAIAYDPETGNLTWKVRPLSHFSDTGNRTQEHSCRLVNARMAGKPALSAVRGKGYLGGKIFGVSLLAHRVAFALAYGWWPEEVDHINGDRADNSLANLREVTRAENAKNRFLSSNNTTGVCGVVHRKKHGKWRAMIQIDGVQRTLGDFSTKDEAIAVRRQAETLHGYSERHGSLAP